MFVNAGMSFSLSGRILRLGALIVLGMGFGFVALKLT